MYARLILILTLILVDVGRTTFAAKTIDLVIPVFEVRNATVKEALAQLRQWGVLISLEKLPSDGVRQFSIRRFSNVSVAEVLDAVVEADSRYTWEVYESKLKPPTRSIIVNVLPRETRDESNLLDIRVKSLELNNIDPEEAITEIHLLIPELASRYWG